MPIEAGDWNMLSNKILGQWQHVLEADLDITHPGQWIGFYKVGAEDPVFIQQCLIGFTPPCMRLHHLFLPLPIQCFTVGTQSRCLNEWENPNGDMVGLFHKVKIIHTTKRQKKDKKGRNHILL